MGDRLGARDDVSLTRVSGFDSAVALSGSREGLGAEPGLSETSPHHAGLMCSCSRVGQHRRRASGAGLRGHASCGVFAAGLTPTGVFSAPLCHQRLALR